MISYRLWGFDIVDLIQVGGGRGVCRSRRNRDVRYRWFGGRQRWRRCCFIDGGGDGGGSIDSGGSFTIFNGRKIGVGIPEETVRIVKEHLKWHHYIKLTPRRYNTVQSVTTNMMIVNLSIFNMILLISFWNFSINLRERVWNSGFHCISSI